MSLYLRLLCVALVVFWLLLSGFWNNGLLLSLGALSVACVGYLIWRIERFYSLRSMNGVLLRLPGYWLWLLKEIIKSNLDVLKRIWLPGKYPISPVIAELPMSQVGAMGKTIYANSITLTPGTVSVKVMPGSRVLVHALSADALADLERGEMNQRVANLEKTS